jgi:hypothetical protein
MKRIIFIKASIYLICMLTHMECGMKPGDFSETPIYIYRGLIDFWCDVYPTSLYTVKDEVYTEGRLVNIIKHHLIPANELAVAPIPS